MEYPYTPYNDIVPTSAPLGHTGRYSLLELARSILLSPVEEHTRQLVSAEIAKLIAVKNTSLTAGVGERWEKTLLEILRSHYCFISHSNAEDRRKICYSCDSTVDPTLRKSNAIKRTFESSTSVSNTTSPRTTTSPSLPPEIRQAEEVSSTSPSKIDKPADDIESATVFELEVSDVYERRHRGDGLIFYCQKCGPYLLERQRWDGRVVTKGLVKLVRLLCGDIVGELSLKALCGLKDDEDWPQTISAAKAREVVDKAHLPIPGNGILSELYPILPNNEAAFVERSGTLVKCRYCGNSFGKKELRRHLLLLEGTCQLEHPLQLKSYLSILHESPDDVAQGHGREADDSSSDEEEASDRPVRPVIGSAFTAWTEIETERFFTGLRRFSKHRCDAIAEHITTKSEIEVLALIDTIEEQISLLDAHEVAAVKRAPAAREMSEAWIKMEERLAEDVVVWEAFVDQAKRTPVELRDSAQQRVADHHLHIHCLPCASRVCDGKRPRCSRCARKDINCRWPDPVNPALEQPSEVYGPSGALGQAYPDYVQQTAIDDSSRAEFLENLSWPHLLALSKDERSNTLSARLSLIWWKVCSSATAETKEPVEALRETSSSTSTRSQRLRKQVARALQSTINDVPLETLEAVFQYMKSRVKADNQDLPSVQAIRDLLDLPEVIDMKGKISGIFAQEKAFGDKRLGRTARSRGLGDYGWSDIPISFVSYQQRQRRPENNGIHEEVQQARKQLRAADVGSSDLGHAGELFDLRNMGSLLDLYRRGSEDVACISKSVLDILAAAVRSHTTRVLALATSMADAKDIPYQMHQRQQANPKELVKCIKEASKLVNNLLGGPKSVRHAPTPDEYLGEKDVAAADGLESQNGRKSRDVINARSLTSSSAPPVPVRTRHSLSKRKTSAFEIEPLNVHALDSFDNDLVLTYGESDWDSTSSSGSETESGDEVPEPTPEEQLDSKLMEDDRLDDHIYEQSLWDLLQSAVRSADAAEGSQPDNDHANEDEGLEHDSYSDNGEESDEAEPEVETNFSLSDDESQAGGDDDETSEPSKKRQRSSKPALATSQALWAGPVYSTARPKIKYRTQGFISTSDEEEMNVYESAQ